MRLYKHGKSALLLKLQLLFLVGGGGGAGGAVRTKKRLVSHTVTYDFVARFVAHHV